MDLDAHRTQSEPLVDEENEKALENFDGGDLDDHKFVSEEEREAYRASEFQAIAIGLGILPDELKKLEENVSWQYFMNDTRFKSSNVYKKVVQKWLIWVNERCGNNILEADLSTLCDEFRDWFHLLPSWKDCEQRFFGTPSFACVPRSFPPYP